MRRVDSLCVCGGLPCAAAPGLGAPCEQGAPALRVSRGERWRKNRTTRWSMIV